MKSYWLTPTGEKIDESMILDGRHALDIWTQYKLGWRLVRETNQGGTLVTQFVPEPQVPRAFRDEPWEAVGFGD